MVDWKKLEEEVDAAIKKRDASHIKFVLNKTLMECKYQQKYAEDKRLVYERVLNVMIFAFALGYPIFLSGFYEQKKELIIIGSVIIILGAAISFFIIKNKLPVFSEIVLKAEQRILSEDSVEPNQPQEPTNTQPQAQENTPARGVNIGKIEFIKAGLDFLKLLASATLAGMFLIVVYNLKTTGADLINVNFSIVMLGFILIIEFGVYVGLMFKLKDLP